MSSISSQEEMMEISEKVMNLNEVKCEYIAESQTSPQEPLRWGDIPHYPQRDGLDFLNLLISGNLQPLKLSLDLQLI